MEKKESCENFEKYDNNLKFHHNIAWLDQLVGYKNRETKLFYFIILRISLSAIVLVVDLLNHPVLLNDLMNPHPELSCKSAREHQTPHNVTGKEWHLRN